ncbi:hypothetical protein HanPI659440_Chr05g0190371 [Helianthus annuus]|nr:hypothetical protein HanPI659440_Chr05g0190371 [Helianthus annuus]
MKFKKNGLRPQHVYPSSPTPLPKGRHLLEQQPLSRHLYQHHPRDSSQHLQQHPLHQHSFQHLPQHSQKHPLKRWHLLSWRTLPQQIWQEDSQDFPQDLLTSPPRPWCSKKGIVNPKPSPHKPFSAWPEEGRSRRNS